MWYSDESQLSFSVYVKLRPVLLIPGWKTSDHPEIKKQNQQVPT